MTNQTTQLNELALFAGAGGGILGGKLLGWRTVCAVEWEPYPASVLVARQNDGFLPPFPIWDDVQTFDGRPWRGIVDVVSGGFPCQDISAAGKGAGIEGARSSMWKHMARIVGEVLPRYVFVENSPMLVGRGLAVVLADLAALGYDARWGVVGADDAGAPHKRERIWIVADAKNDGVGRREQQQKGGKGSRQVANASQLFSNGRDYHAAGGARHQPIPQLGNNGRTEDLANSNGAQRQGVRRAERGSQERANSVPPGAWWRSDPADCIESPVGRVAHGVAARVDRLKAIGNGQVPSVAALAWEILSGDGR